MRIIATVDHVNSPLLWSLTESSTYRWLWFHVATFSPYLVERKHSSSQSSIFTTGSKSWKQSTNLLAVKQVYNSVNSNAQKIFLTILKLYIESRSRNSTFTFYTLYLSCREEFLVNSEVTLREHLAEFKYHNLIKMTKASDGAESIQVIIDKETVKRFNDSVGEEWEKLRHLVKWYHNQNHFWLWFSIINFSFFFCSSRTTCDHLVIIWHCKVHSVWHDRLK